MTGSLINRIIEMTPKHTQPTDTQRELDTAARQYLRRKHREENPHGSFDNSGRWYPSESERQPCCSCIRAPSRGYPYSYLVHCRTAEHISWLSKVFDTSAIRRRARELEITKNWKEEAQETNTREPQTRQDTISIEDDQDSCATALTR